MARNDSQFPDAPSSAEKQENPTTINARQDQDSSEIVDWEGPDDPLNPQNWSNGRKWSIIVMVSAIAFNQGISTRILAPAIPQVLREFHSSDPVDATMLVSIPLIGLAVGPLVLGPLSELYGRSALVHGTNVAFLITSVLCAVSVDMRMLLAFRFFVGASSLSLGGGYVADMMASEHRSRAMNVWNVGPVVVGLTNAESTPPDVDVISQAESFGPVAGGYIALHSSWRWTCWFVAIVAATLSVGCVFILRESYPPKLLAAKAKRLRTETGNLSLRSKYHKSQTPLQLICLSIIRPTKMLVQCPIVALLSLFLGIAYSYMFLLFTTFTNVFEQTYGFNAGEAGLSYLGLGLGALVGQYTLDAFMKRYIKRQMAKNGRIQPEDHLPPIIAGSISIAVGLFWYGWSVEYKIHWIVPIVATSFCGVGVACTFLGVLTYLVEAFALYAASAMAANTVVRCIFAGLIPLLAPPLYGALGLGWGNTLLGFLALMIVPASLGLWRYGERIRNDPRFQPNL